ncbi:MAG: PAS domain-containing protein [Aggregatilineales bacterium]
MQKQQNRPVEDVDSGEIAMLRRQLETAQAAFVSAAMEKNFLKRAVADLNFHHNAHDGIVFTDANNRVVYANPYFLRMMNISDPAELLNKPLPNYMWSDPTDPERLFHDVRSDGFVRERELSLFNQDGAPVFAACSSVASRDDIGNYIGTEIMLCNVTSKRKIQAELVQRTQTLTRITELCRESLAHLAEIVQHGAQRDEILAVVNDAQRTFDQALTSEVGQKKTQEAKKVQTNPAIS